MAVLPSPTGGGLTQATGAILEALFNRAEIEESQRRFDIQAQQNQEILDLRKRQAELAEEQTRFEMETQLFADMKGILGQLPPGTKWGDLSPEVQTRASERLGVSPEFLTNVPIQRATLDDLIDQRAIEQLGTMTGDPTLGQKFMNFRIFGKFVPDDIIELGEQAERNALQEKVDFSAAVRAMPEDMRIQRYMAQAGVYKLPMSLGQFGDTFYSKEALETALTLYTTAAEAMSGQAEAQQDWLEFNIKDVQSVMADRGYNVSPRWIRDTFIALQNPDFSKLGGDELEEYFNSLDPGQLTAFKYMLGNSLKNIASAQTPQEAYEFLLQFAPSKTLKDGKLFAQFAEAAAIAVSQQFGIEDPMYVFEAGRRGILRPLFDRGAGSDTPPPAAEDSGGPAFPGAEVSPPSEPELPEVEGSWDPIIDNLIVPPVRATRDAVFPRRERAPMTGTPPTDPLTPENIRERLNR